MIYNENDQVRHTDGTELIIIESTTNNKVFGIPNDGLILYKCFSKTTQLIVYIHESELEGFKELKQ